MDKPDLNTTPERRLTWDTPVDQMCRAGKDGECNWCNCPQERDGEPARSGRFCPLPGWGDDDR